MRLTRHLDLLFTTVPSASVLLSTIVGAINTPSVHKSIVRRHLQFLAGPFATRYPEMAVEIVQQAFFGGLLITKPRQVMASGAWEVLAGKLEGFDLFWSEPLDHQRRVLHNRLIATFQKIGPHSHYTGAPAAWWRCGGRKWSSR